jgi:hypothetical protein
MIGHPRVEGLKLTSPQAVVAQTTTGACIIVAWYGGDTRDMECVTGTGYWYRVGEALVAVRWVYVHDVTGTHRNEYSLSMDLCMRPQQIVESYIQRLSVENTFQ